LTDLCDNGDGTFFAVDASDSDADVVRVDTYDSATYALLRTQTVPMELEEFGGFYAGENYNYIVFGQTNIEEDDNKEVIRVVKYDKNWNRLDAASITGGDSFTIVPFDAGSLRMAENGDELVIHTSRKRYTTEDGLNHQSQLTLILNTQTMTVQNSLGRFQTNHVSHSFNQFVQYDGDQIVLLDHGDAYPRSVVLQKGSGRSYGKTTLFSIPGETGANCTGVTVGGFEISDSSYLVAINTIDHSKVAEYTSYQMIGLGLDERNVVLLVSDKSSTGSAKQVTLTDYIGQNELGSTPYLVKLSDDRFLVLWEEFETIDGSQYYWTDHGVRCVEVDGEGNLLTEVQSLPYAKLSSDCQPIYLNGEVVWYLNMVAGRMFYHIPV
jgi:hypothetical protein